MALYSAASVYVYMCKEAQAPASYADNLDFVIAAMEALGRNHTITQAFLRQVVVDIEQNDIQHFVRLPRLDNLGDEFNTQISHNIPLVARSSISRHSKVQPPLPGRLPLGKPVGKIISDEIGGCDYGTWVSESGHFDSFSPETHSTDLGSSSSNNNGNKRKRTSPPGATVSGTLDGSSETGDRFWAASGGIQDHVAANPSATHSATHSSSPTNPLAAAAAAAKATANSQPASCGSGYGVAPRRQVNLPHRTCSPSLHGNVNANASADTTEAMGAPQPPGSVRLGTGVASAVLGNMRRPACREGRTVAVTAATAMNGGPLGDWEVAGMCMHNQFAANGPGAAAFPEPEPQPQTQQDGLGDNSIPWSLAGDEGMNVAVDWDAIGASFGIDTGGGVASGSGPGAAGGSGGGTGSGAG